MTPDLKVFISSKEGELESERLIVKKVIESLFLNPIGSEERSATYRSMTEVNKQEVRSSHIYIGLFKGLYSKATIDEYRIATSSQKILFIFKKYLKESEHIDEELKEFLKEIEDPDRGIVTEYFINIFDLKWKVKKAIMEFLSDYYLTKSAIEIDTPPKATIVSDDIEYFDDTVEDTYLVPKDGKIVELTDNELIKFGFNLSNKFHNKVKIKKALLPDIIKDIDLDIYVEIFGTVSKGFLDLFIRDSENNDLWFPDEGTWDKNNDQGSLELKDSYKSCRWSFKIPDYAKKNFRIYVLVFEDSDGHTLDKRKVVTGVEVLINKKNLN
jgi:hypothetical protein